MAEWFKAHAWKACVAKNYREFESLSLRHFFFSQTSSHPDAPSDSTMQPFNHAPTFPLPKISHSAIGLPVLGKSFMKSNLFTLLGAALLTAFLTGSAFTAHAQEKEKTEASTPAAPKIDPNRKLPFYAKVAAVDKKNKTLKLGQRVFKVMPDTKMIKGDDQPATLDDAKIGEIAGGSYRNNDGTLELVMIRFGPKPEKKKTASKS